MLPCVKKAEENLMSKALNKEYAPIGGEADYGKLTANLAFGEGNFFPLLSRNSQEKILVQATPLCPRVAT